MDIFQSERLSRRRFLISAGALGAAWLGPRGHRFHQGPGIVEQVRRAAAVDPMQVQPLRGNLSAIIGSGGNIVALPGLDGVLLIDSGIVGPRVAAFVATISKAPIRHVINTHWHFDHTDANGWLHAHGAAITAHENTRKHLSMDTRVADWDFTFPRAVAGAIPASVFATDRSLAWRRAQAGTASPAARGEP